VGEEYRKDNTEFPVSAGIPHIRILFSCTRKYKGIVHSDHQRIVVHHGYFPILIYYDGVNDKKTRILKKFSSGTEEFRFTGKYS
jgi:hypothetical protein